MKTRIMLLALSLLSLAATGQVRVERTLDKGWRFTREDDPAFAAAACDVLRGRP